MAVKGERRARCSAVDKFKIGSSDNDVLDHSLFQQRRVLVAEGIFHRRK